MRFSGSRSPPPTSAPSGCCRRSWPTTWPPTPTDCARWPRRRRSGPALGTGGGMRPAPRTREEYIAGLYRVVAAVSLFATDPEGRVLLFRPVYRPDGLWSLPGGSIEEDETPRQALVREIREELDLQISPGRLLAVGWAPANDRA